MKSGLSDETLMAYADGQLSDAEARDIDRALVTDLDARARVDAFVQSRKALAGAFDDIMDEPPAHLLAAIESGGKVVSIRPAAATARSAPRTGFWPTAMAASIALAIGLAGGFGLRGVTTEEATTPVLAQGGRLALSDDVAAALDRTPSLARAEIAGAATIVPVLSFRAGDGALCREFELSGGEARATGIACRRDEAWRLEALVAGGSASAGEDFAPASGADEKTLERVLQRLGAGDPLSADDEAALLRPASR
jgi:hypothetical protein